MLCQPVDLVLQVCEEFTGVCAIHLRPIENRSLIGSWKAIMSMGMVVFVDKKSKIMTLSMNSGVFVDKGLILRGLSTNRGQIMDKETPSKGCLSIWR